MIPILDLKKQILPLRKEIDAAIKKVIDNANFVLGKEISDFEDAVKNYTHSKFAVGVSNGTDAIKLALIATGVKAGDGVICPAFTYYATAGAIAAIGARPVFCDITPDTYNISLDSIKDVLKKRRKFKIKAIIPVHLFGQCADMDGILKIARKFSLTVIEDNAQAFGAEYKNRKSGTLGDCAAVSFFPGKNLGAFGDAGMALTNQKGLEEKIKVLRNQGNKNKYYHLTLGHNNRLDTIQAAVLLVKLSYLDKWNKKRQANASYYNKKLEGFSITTPFVADYTTHIYHQYVLRVSQSNKKIVRHLNNEGIDARVYYPIPLHLQKCFRYLGYKKGLFPESESASCCTFAIPVYPDLTIQEMDYIIEVIRGGL